MAVVVNNPRPIDPLSLYPCATLTYWPKTHTMADDIQIFDALSICQSRANIYASLHDSQSQIRVRQRIPVPFLIATA